MLLALEELALSAYHVQFLVIIRQLRLSALALVMQGNIKQRVLHLFARAAIILA